MGDVRRLTGEVSTAQDEMTNLKSKASKMSEALSAATADAAPSGVGPVDCFAKISNKSVSGASAIPFPCGMSTSKMGFSLFNVS